MGALFSLLYGISLIFTLHVLAIYLGIWSYGGGALMLLDFPADIWFGGALLLGPVLFLVLPGVNPWLVVLPFVALNGAMLPRLAPFFTVGPGWFPAVVLVMLCAHLPALFLARWTAADTHLPFRAALLAVAYGCFAFFATPTVIMRAMGGGWAALANRPIWTLALAGTGMLSVWIMGLSAVQMFALHGDGTPIPLDPTKRLVRTGIYAYLSNPMQLATALGWLVLGAVLGSAWVALGAVMAVCFVLGMVRWHHRQDLEVRFPVGWPEYRAHVPEWRPRWHPWVPEPARFRFDPAAPVHRAATQALRWLAPASLDMVEAPGPLSYREPDEVRTFTGMAAFAKALNHANLLTALLGAGLLLVVLPVGVAIRLVTAPRAREERWRA